MKITPKQRELLELLSRGPRYGFTDLRLINVLVEKGLAKKRRAKNMAGNDWYITDKGRSMLPPPLKFDQGNSQDCPGFVEAFRVMP